MKKSSKLALLAVIIASSATNILSAESAVQNTGETKIYEGAFVERGILGNPMKKFREVFYIENRILDKVVELDLRDSQPKMSVGQAAAAIRDSVKVDHLVVLESKLVNLDVELGAVGINSLEGKFFYFVKVYCEERISSYVVLFDGSVVKSRLEEIDKEDSGFRISSLPREAVDVGTILPSESETSK